MLDNCSQCWLAARGVSVLATSREALALTGEQRIRLQPLATPPPDDGLVPIEELARYSAIELFVERARQARPEFRLTQDNAQVVAQVCAGVDGIPLALELAAARVPVLSVEQIAQRLHDALQLLGGGRRSAPSRQQTLLAALDWSRALLSEPEQAVFRRLAVFAGGSDLGAVEAICAGAGVDEADVLDLLQQLVDKSLLLAVPRTTRNRYRLLEPVRQYAQRQLAAAGELTATRRRHAFHYLPLAERAEPELHGSRQAGWQERLDLERDNLRAALRWAQELPEPRLFLRLAVAPVGALLGSTPLSRRSAALAGISTGRRRPSR